MKGTDGCTSHHVAGLPFRVTRGFFYDGNKSAVRSPSCATADVKSSNFCWLAGWLLHNAVIGVNLEFGMG